MTTKRARKSGKKVKDLRAKGLTARQAKQVKGGVIAIISPTKKVGTSLLLPAVQKVRG